MRRLFALIASWLAVAAAAADSLHMDPDILHGTLDCGLQYYILRCLRPAYKVNFYLVENAGSAVEDSTQRGMMHFIEHMAFNGSDIYPDRSMIQHLERHGLKFGYDINAHTNVDATVYRITSLDATESPQMIDSCLLMLKGISQSLTLAEEAIENERKIITEEWRQGNNSFTRIAERMFPVLYGQGNAYCNMPIGDLQVVTTFEPDSLRAFYKKWYQPQHQAIVVVGYVRPKEIEKQIRRIWSDVKRPADPSVRVWTQIDNHQGVEAAVITDPEFGGCQIDLWFKIDIPPRGHRSSVAYLNDSMLGWMASHILADRLGDVTYEPDAPWSAGRCEIGQYYYADSKDALRMYCLYDRNRRPEALARLITEAKSIATHGITPEELTLAKQYFTSVANSLPTFYDEKNNFDQFDRISQHVLQDNIVLSAKDTEKAYRAFIDTVGIRQVNAYLARHIKPDNLTAIMVEKEVGDPSMPTDSTFKAEIESLWRDIETKPYVADTSYNRPLVDATLIPPQPEPRLGTVDSLHNARLYWLANGAPLIVARHGVRSDQVDVRAVRRGGESVMLDKGFADGYYAPTLADIGGLGDFSASQLSRKLKGTQIGIETYHTPYAEIIKGESRVDEFETLAQLLRLRMTTVRHDSTAFANFVRIRRGQFNDRANDPNNIFMDSIYAALYCHRRQFMRRATLADLDSLDFDHSLQLFAERMANPADFNYIVTGNVDFDTVAQIMQRYIGSIPCQRSEVQAPFRHVMRQAINGKREIRFTHPMSSPLTKVYMAYELHRAYDLEDEMTMKVLREILEEDCIRILRQEEGGTYTATVGAESGERDGYHALFIQFDTNPEMAQELVDKVRQTLTDIAEHGVDEEQFARAYNYLAEEEYTAKLQSNFLMAYFTHIALYDDGHVDWHLQALSRVDPKTLQQMARAIVNAPVQVTVIMDGQ